MILRYPQRVRMNKDTKITNLLRSYRLAIAIPYVMHGETLFPWNTDFVISFYGVSGIWFSEEIWKCRPKTKVVGDCWLFICADTARCLFITRPFGPSIYWWDDFPQCPANFIFLSSDFKNIFNFQFNNYLKFENNYLF